MINKKKAYINRLFFLIRVALWGGTSCKKMSAEEFTSIMTLAEEQTITGLIFDVLKEIQVDVEAEVEVIKSSAVTEYIIQTNRQLNKELISFASICTEEQIPYIVVKGQTIGCLYKKPLLRVPGDIDFLVNEDYTVSRIKIEKALCVSLPTIMLENQVPFDRNDIRYELHTSLRSWLYKKHQEKWNEIIDDEWKNMYYVEIGNHKIRTLSPTTNAAYVFIHLFFHFIREGISLRQLCDWALVLHHYKDEIDRVKLKQYLHDLGIWKPFKTFGAILIDELGLPQEDFPFIIGDKERKWKNKILDDIFIGGNFGKQNHKAHSLWKYKIETMRIATYNSIKYYSLSPIEAGLIIPRLIIGNIMIILRKWFL